MSIWVDADACPVMIREIICRAAIRTNTPVYFVANQALPLVRSPLVRMVQVAPGFDVADNHIVRQARAGDLVITSDIPLAAELIEKEVQVITSRGERYNRQNIRQKLNMRDFMDTMRSSGAVHGGPPPIGNREKQAFANSLDQYLAKLSQ